MSQPAVNIGALGVGTTTPPNIGAVQSTGTAPTGKFATVFAGVIR